MTISDLAYTVAQSFQKLIEVKIAKSPVPNRPPARYVPSTKLVRMNLGIGELVNLGEAIDRTIVYLKALREV